jgi:hypothetical protein
MATTRWPDLPYHAWKDTYATLHMWMQVVGKVAVATAPHLNHCWGSAFRVTARGLSTNLLTSGTRRFSISFDFVDHLLIVETVDGERRTLPLTPMPVADFYRDVMATLQTMQLPVTIWPMPVEVPSPIRFNLDTGHASYDRQQAHALWAILVEVERVFTQSRCGFVGKVSPTHFFWGSCDLAVTRFSGRTAPPREGPAFMRDAYSHEVISHGFWPGNDALPEPVFYAYAVPEPAGLKDAAISPAAAYYHRELGEFILPYAAVRAAADPAAMLTEFIESTYQQAATLAHWDRAALER